MGPASGGPRAGSIGATEATEERREESGRSGLTRQAIGGGRVALEPQRSPGSTEGHWGNADCRWKVSSVSVGMDDARHRVFGFQLSVFSWWGLRAASAEWRVLSAKCEVQNAEWRRGTDTRRDGGTKEAGEGHGQRRLQQAWAWHAALSSHLMATPRPARSPGPTHRPAA